MFEVHSTFNNGNVLPISSHHSVDEALRTAASRMNSKIDTEECFIKETKVVLSNQIIFTFYRPT